MTSYTINDLDVHPKIAAAAIKAGFKNAGKLLEIPLREIKLKTGLNDTEVDRLLNAVIQLICPPCISVWEMYQSGKEELKPQIKLGCEFLDKVLGGGFLRGAVTEIAGESSSGKTQMSLVLALQTQLTPENGGIAKCVAYLCTETQFPVVRLNQIKACRNEQSTFNLKQFSDNIFVHHLPDMDNLVDCVRYQLPHIIDKKNIGVIIIDSVASVFRAGEESQLVKSKTIQQLGFLLRQLATKHNVAVVAVNQVSASMGPSLYGLSDNVTPALGLSWANLVTTRLMLHKSPYCIPSKDSSTEKKNSTEIRVRVMEVVFCPWLPRKSSPFIITQSGIEDVTMSTDNLYIAT